MDNNKNIDNALKNGIWGTMYGEPFDENVSGLVFIKPEKLYVRSDSAFQFVWGGPGPDFNIYYFKDYGKTWALKKSDFKR